MPFFTALSISGWMVAGKPWSMMIAFAPELIAEDRSVACLALSAWASYTVRSMPRALAWAFAPLPHCSK